MSTYKFDGAIPGTRDEAVLGDGIPANRKRFPLVFVEVHDREVLHPQVEELDGAIAASDNELILVELRPGKIVLGIVCLKGLFALDAGCAQAQAEEATVADDAIVGGSGDSEA